MLGSGIKGVSNQSLLGKLHAALDELGVDLLLHEDARGSRAALPLVEEHALVGTFHCQVHWEMTQEGKVLPHAQLQHSSVSRLVFLSRWKNLLKNADNGPHPWKALTGPHCP